jgi:hypothetical protein
MKTYFIVNVCILDDEPTIRDEQYKTGISKLIELTREMIDIQIVIVENNGGKQKYLEDYKNDVNCTTFYTNNNRNIETGNIGIKELIDVLNCINRFDIGDDDFIVKINGRYLLNDDSEFIAALKNTIVKTTSAITESVTEPVVEPVTETVTITEPVTITETVTEPVTITETVTEPTFIEYQFETPIATTSSETHCIIKYGSYETPVNYKTGECISALIGMRGKFVKQINIPRMDERAENVWAAASLSIDDQNIVMLEKLGINVCPGNNDYFLI